MIVDIDDTEHGQAAIAEEKILVNEVHYRVHDDLAVSSSFPEFEMETTMSRAKILIVEDEAILAMDLQDKLMDMGHSVLASIGTGEAAIVAAKDLHPDLVLMDIGLKGDMDGVEACRQIRARLGIPVVFMSAYSDEAAIQRAMLADPYGYLIKPFDLRALHNAIQSALHRYAAERNDYGGGIS